MQSLLRTARTTGLLYLGLAISGGLGFLALRTRLFAPGDPAGTLAQLVDHPWLGRAQVALELATVLTQALAALWFFRLFRTANAVAAAAIGAFGLVNAIAVLVSSALLATAVEVAHEPFGDAATTVQLMYLVSGHLWGVGGLFFGLWLIPMGRCVIGSRWMPAALGWVLVVGGVGYVLGTFTRYLVPNAATLAGTLTYVASVGEFWMIVYLLSWGVRRRALDAATPEAPRATAPHEA